MQTLSQSLKSLLAVILLAASPMLAAAQASAPIAAQASPASDFTLSRGTPQREVAERALAAWVARPVLDGDRRLSNRIFAVDSPRALRDATIGYGFEVYLIDPASLLAGNHIETSLRRSGVWRFVVLLGGRPIGLVTVARMQGQWKMVQIGAAVLAQDISSVVNDYAKDPSAPQLRFIRSKQGLADFIEVIATGAGAPRTEPEYVPLLSAKDLAVSSRAGSDDAAEVKRASLREDQIIDALRASVERGLYDPRFSH